MIHTWTTFSVTTSLMIADIIIHILMRTTLSVVAPVESKRINAKKIKMKWHNNNSRSCHENFTTAIVHRKLGSFIFDEK